MIANLSGRKKTTKNNKVKILNAIFMWKKSKSDKLFHLFIKVSDSFGTISMETSRYA